MLVVLLASLLLTLDVGLEATGCLANVEGRLFVKSPLDSCGLALPRIPRDRVPVAGSRARGSAEFPGGLNLEVVLRDSIFVVVEEAGGDLVEANCVRVREGRVTLTLLLNSFFRRFCAFLTSSFFSFSSLSVFPIITKDSILHIYEYV